MMTVERAIEIVLDLARENMLDETLAKNEGLEETFNDQREAINVIEDFFTNVVFR